MLEGVEGFGVGIRPKGWAGLASSAQMEVNMLNMLKEPGQLWPHPHGALLWLPLLLQIKGG